MRLVDLLGTIRVSGATLARAGERLRYHRKDALVSELLAALREHAAAWLAALDSAPTLDADGWANCGRCGREHYGLTGRSSLCHYCRPLWDGEPVPLDLFQHRVGVELGGAVLRQVGDARLGGEPVAVVVDVEVVRGVGQVWSPSPKVATRSPGWTQPSLICWSSSPLTSAPQVVAVERLSVRDARR